MQAVVFVKHRDSVFKGQGVCAVMVNTYQSTSDEFLNEVVRLQ